MLLVHALAFDDIISGTSGTWYTASQLQPTLGAADAIAVHACTRFVSGSGAALAILAEHSSDNHNWIAVSPLESPEISTTIQNDGSYFGWYDGLNPILMSFLRFKITLAGTNPKCRLKLYVTGRVRAGTPSQAVSPQQTVRPMTR